MITVRLKGGLGNQMFQYAFARAMAARNDDALALDLTYLLDRRPRRDFVFRGYDLDVFPIDPRFTLLSRVARRAPVPIIWLGASEAWRRAKALAGQGRYVRERPGLHVDELPMGGDIFLDGYWQDERLFAGVAKEIREVFRSEAPLPAASATLHASIRASASVCVNVRRGDFVHHPGSARTHGFVGADYYARAMRLVEERVAEPRVFVFSDDVAWCEENLRFEHPTTYVGHEHAGPKFGRYLALMRSCRHFVIPNSTFGWWAAWLGEHEASAVVAPARWYATPQPLPDPVPDRWLRA